MEKPFSFPAACDIIMYYCILEVPHMEKTRREIMDRVYLTYLPAKKFKTRLPVRPVHHPPAPGNGVLWGAAAAGAPAGHHELPGHPAAFRRHGPALRRTDQPHHPQAGGVPVHRLCGLGNGRQLRPPGRKAAGAHRRPAGGAAAGPRHPQRPVSGGICGQRAGQPAGQPSAPSATTSGTGRTCGFCRRCARYEPYGVSRLGDEAAAAAINNQKLHAYSRQMMAASRLELFYCGSAPHLPGGGRPAGGLRRPAPGRGPGPGAAPCRGRPGGAPHHPRGHGRDPGEAVHGLPLRHRRCARHDPGKSACSAAPAIPSSL